MATISANGGAERLWRDPRTGSRACLCRNGRLLLNPGGRNGWKRAERLTVADMEKWEPVEAPGIVTRTVAEAAARRRGRGDGSR